MGRLQDADASQAIPLPDLEHARPSGLANKHFPRFTYLGATAISRRRVADPDVA